MSQSDLVMPAEGVADPRALLQAQVQTQRIMFMSRGLAIALLSIFLPVMIGLGVVFADYGMYVAIGGAICGGIFANIIQALEKHRSKYRGYVKTFKPSSLKEHLALYGIIAAGTLLIIAMAMFWASFDYYGPILGIGMFFSFLIFFAVYFIRMGRSCALWEINGLGAWFLVTGLFMAALMFYEPVDDKVPEGFTTILIAAVTLTSVYFFVLGISLHKRWLDWRKSIEDQAA